MSTCYFTKPPFAKQTQHAPGPLSTLRHPRLPAFSILTTLNLVSLGVPKVISKATSAEHGEILEKLGAEVVYPERDMAIRLAHRLETEKMLDFVQLSERLNVLKLLAPDRIIGKSVVNVNLRRDFGINIVAIENSGILLENISPDYVFQKNDILFMVGDKSGLNRFLSWSKSASNL